MEKIKGIGAVLRRSMLFPKLLVIGLIAAGLLSTSGVAKAHEYQSGTVGAHDPASVTCILGGNTLSITPNMQTAPGWARQWIAYRFFVYDYATKTWSSTAWFTGYQDGPKPNTILISAPHDVTVSGSGYKYVYTQYGWWDGRSWSVDGSYTRTYNQGTWVYPGTYSSTGCEL